VRGLFGQTKKTKESFNSENSRVFASAVAGDNLDLNATSRQVLALPRQLAKMDNRKRIRLLPAALLALVVSIPASQAATNTLDFSFYPPNAQRCLYSAAEDSGCEADTVAETNTCFCNNGGNFISNTATCVGRTAPDDVYKTYTTMRDACDYSKTPLAFTQDDFMAAAQSGQSEATSSTSRATKTRTKTTTPDEPTETPDSTDAIVRTDAPKTTDTPEPTDTPDSDPDQDPADGTKATGPATVTVIASVTPFPTAPADDEKEGDSGLSTGAMAGIIAGAIGGFVVLGAIVYILMKHRKKGGEEYHPMLPQHSPYSGNPSHMSLGGTSPYDTAYYGAGTDSAWQQGKKEWATSPDIRTASTTGGFNWDTANTVPYAGAAPTAPPAVVIQELDGREAFRPGSVQAPAEMSGSPVIVGVPSQPQPQSGVTGTQQQQDYSQQQYPGSWQQR
jgi:hypothetical protein